MSRVTAVVFGIALAAATFAWLATVATALSLHQSDNAGNGMSYSFGTLGVIITWVLLAIVLLMAFRHITYPTWLPLVAAVGLLGSGAAAFTVFNLLKDNGHFPAQWPIVTLIVAPLLMLGFAAWAAFPSVQRLVEPRLMFIGAWSAVLVLSALPFPVRVAQTKRLTRERETYMRAQETREAEERANWRNDLTTLSDTAPLSEFLALTTRSTEMREAVLARVQTLPNRQRDVVTMLKARDGSAMGELRNLGLEITPELCERGVEFLRSHAVDYRGKRNNDNNRFVIAAQELDKYLFGMQWLAERKCNVTPAVNAYKETALLYPDSSERAAFLARLDALAVASGFASPAK